MKPTNPVYIGAPLTGDEARFLRALEQRFAGSEHLILANFLLADQQIDFVLVIAAGASLIELKNFSRAVFGERNGVWEHLDASVRTSGIRRQSIPAGPEAEVRAERRHPEVPEQHRRRAARLAGASLPTSLPLSASRQRSRPVRA